MSHAEAMTIKPHTACHLCIHFQTTARGGRDPYASETRCHGPACDSTEWIRRSAKIQGYVPLDATQDCDSFARTMPEMQNTDPQPTRLITLSERALVTAQEIRVLAVEFIGAMQDAGRLAAALADAEAQHRAALSAAGVPHCHRPPARELAAEIALGYLEPLRPHVAAVTTSSRDRAAEVLTSMPCATLPAALEEPCPF